MFVSILDNFLFHSQGAGFPDTIYGQATTETRLTSQTADSILWARLTGPNAEPGLASSRITFDEITTPRPLHAILEYARTQLSEAVRKTLIVAVGRGRRLAVESHQAELRELALRTRAQSTGDLRKTVGDVASAFIIASNNQVLVLQASAATTEEV